MARKSVFGPSDPSPTAFTDPQTPVVKTVKVLQLERPFDPSKSVAN